MWLCANADQATTCDHHIENRKGGEEKRKDVLNMMTIDAKMQKLGPSKPTRLDIRLVVITIEIIIKSWMIGESQHSASKEILGLY